jgi:putative oxidoreductase
MDNNDLKASVGALTLRVSLGIMFIAHALLKLVVFSPAGAAAFFESQGVPGIFSYIVILTELVGGVALIAGFKTRIVSLALTPILVSAIVFVHGSNGWFFSNEGGGWEFPLFWLVALIVQALLGDGAYAITSWVPALQKRKAS